MRPAHILATIAALALSSGCNITDTAPPIDRPTEGSDCSRNKEGDQLLDLRCEDGIWVKSPPLTDMSAPDLGVQDMSTPAPGDMDPPDLDSADSPSDQDQGNQDMPRGGDMACEPPAREQACAGRCGAIVVTTDCGEEIVFECAEDTCEVGESCVNNACCVATPDEDLCAGAECGVVKATDACGERDVSCGMCGEAEVCDEVVNSCTCPTPACAPGECGTISNACGQAVECSCATDQICDANACVAHITIQPPAMTQTANSFGAAVAIDGDLLAVGAPSGNLTGGSNKSGAVFLYQRDAASRAWDLLPGGSGILTSPTSNNNDHFFGTSLALDATAGILAVGAPGQNKVFIYTRGPMNDWTLDRTLDAPNLLAQAFPVAFGFSLALQGDRLAVGDPYATRLGAQEQGAFHIYDRDAQGGWNLADIEKYPSNEYQHVGHALWLDGDAVYVGSPGNISGPVREGEVYQYELSGNEWEEVRRSPFETSITNSGDQFGASLVMDNGDLIVGVPDARVDATNDDGGKIIVFANSVSGADSELIPGALYTPMAQDTLGYSMAARGGVVVVGQTGSDSFWDETRIDGTRSGALILHTDATGARSVARYFSPPDNASYYAGTDVALDDETIVVGAPLREDTAQPLADRVYLLPLYK